MATIAAGVIVHTMAVVGPSSIVQIPPAGLRFSRQHPHPYSLRPDCCRYDHDKVQMNVGFPFCELILSAATTFESRDVGLPCSTPRSKADLATRPWSYWETCRLPRNCRALFSHENVSAWRRQTSGDIGNAPRTAATDPSRDSRRPSDRRHPAGREPDRRRPARPMPSPPGAPGRRFRSCSERRRHRRRRSGRRDLRRSSCRRTRRPG